MKPTLTSLFCILATLIFHAQKTQPDQYFPIFQESFENNNKNWHPLQDEMGMGFIENGVLQLACIEEEAACTQWMPGLKINTKWNFNISVESTWIDGISDATYEIEWGIDENESHSFSFGITADGRYQYSIFEKDAWKNTIPLTQSEFINKNGKNKFGIQKINESIVFFINDKKVNEAPFREFFGQKMSLVIWGKQLVHFDQINIGYLHNVKSLIQMAVQEKMNLWQRKGEFEKSADYALRVTEENKKKKIQEIQSDVIDQLKKIYAANFSFSDFKLGQYDADNETYLIQSEKYGNYIVSVPIDDAAFVKNNFSNFTFKNPEFYLKENQLQLSHFELLGGNNFKLFYDAKDQLTYKNSVIEYHFENLDIAIENESIDSKSEVLNETIVYGKSDVDINIPNCSDKNPSEKTFALIIGNELYTKEIKVAFALNDARIFKKYLEKTLGIPSGNIQMLENGTYGQILDALKWISDITKAFKGEAKVIFYYAGHGVPDEQTKGAYLLPVDGNAQNTLTAIKLDEVYRQLSTHPTKSTIVFLDACFSGAARAENEMLAEGRGVKIKPKAEILSGNLIVLSAATGDETALPYTEKEHGIFTYYLLKKMQETKGNVHVKDLAEYINTQVSQQSLIVNKKSQTPQVNVSTSFANDWTMLKLK
jgi:hypothetical protein